MKARKIILLSAIALLCGVYTLQIVFGGRDSVKVLKLADKIDTIVIATGTNASPLTISKDGDKWILGDKKYPADSSFVEGMVTALAEIKTLGTVSGSGDYERYGLNEEARPHRHGIEGREGSPHGCRRQERFDRPTVLRASGRGKKRAAHFRQFQGKPSARTRRRFATA